MLRTNSRSAQRVNAPPSASFTSIVFYSVLPFPLSFTTTTTHTPPLPPDTHTPTHTMRTLPRLAHPVLRRGRPQPLSPCPAASRVRDAPGTTKTRGDGRGPRWHPRTAGPSSSRNTPGGSLRRHGTSTGKRPSASGACGGRTEKGKVADFPRLDIPTNL